MTIGQSGMANEQDIIVSDEEIRIYDKEIKINKEEGMLNKPLMGICSQTEEKAEASNVYTVGETPPCHISLLLGFQHYLAAVGGIISMPLILSEHFCMDEDIVGLSELIGTILFVSGLATILQTTFGVRLPIVQGSSPTFVIPTIAILAHAQWECPYREARKQYGVGVNFTAIGLPEVGSDAHRDIWTARIREIQGAIMVASLFQIFIGLSGIMTFALRYIGPLTIVPVIALTGISLVPVGYSLASGHWWIALMTMSFVLLFSQYLKHIKISTCFGKSRVEIFNIFPVLLAMILGCLICLVLTITNVFPKEPSGWGYVARTDRNMHVLLKSKWFRFPYPGQWGVPTLSIAGVFGMVAGVLAAMLESIGDYYACARLAGAQPPPTHAINRGIFMEGVACVIAGAWGSGNGTTSFSENIGVIGITKVGSRRVVQVGGCIMLVLGCFGKFSALFTMIPTPVFGGLFMVTFGMVTAVGLSNLQYVDLNSPRNLCVIGVSLFLGICVPVWMQENDAIHTGSEVADQIVSVLLRTSMFVGGVVGFVLDNTIPGTDRERGISSWRETSLKHASGDPKQSSGIANEDIYYPPFLNHKIYGHKLIRYIPILPNMKSVQHVPI